jgi:catechol 2,3-dioxygenase-like lactoylglutathione lyase family enzyme
MRRFRGSGKPTPPWPRHAVDVSMPARTSWNCRCDDGARTLVDPAAAAGEPSTGSRIVGGQRLATSRRCGMRTKHVALHVPDLQHAEGFYRRVFDLDVVTREALTSGSLTDDGSWAQLPRTATWEDVRLAALEVQMVGLRRGDLLLALFPGDPQPGTVFLIAIVATVEEVASVRGRLPGDTPVEVDQEDALTFLDPFGFRWQLCGPGFAGAGDTRGRWLEVP